MKNRYDVLDRLSPLNGPLFLEASAGCGKTFAIEHLVTRLLLNDPNLSLSEVLIVTFTKAATKDLKRRIHQTLIESAKQLENETCHFPYLNAYRKQCIKNTLDPVWRIKALLATIEEASIYTIHGYAHKMLSSFFFEADLSLQEEEPPLYDSSVTHQFLKNEAKESTLAYSQWHLLQQKHKKNVPKLIETLCCLSQEETLPQKLEDFSEFTNKVALLLSNTTYEYLIEDVSLSAQSNKGLCRRDKTLHPQWLPFLQTINAVCQGEKEAIPKLLLYPNPFPLLIKEAKKPLHNAEAFSLIKETLSPMVVAMACQERTMITLASIYKKKHPSTITLSSLLPAMKNTLTNTVFLDSVRSLTKAIIIDEFQDTDTLQWEIFRTLFFNHKTLSTFCVVGDPKQSIYGFRNANLATYLEAKALFGKDNVYTLDTNWRSSSHLVNTLNTLLSEKSAPGWLSFSESNQQLAYEHVLSPFNAKENTSLTLFTTSGVSTKQWPAQSLEHSALFPYIVQEIYKLKESTPLHEIAILVKDRFQADRLQRYLAPFFLPSSIASSQLLMHTPIWSLFMAIARALNQPALSKVLSVLSFPLLHWDFSALHEDNEAVLHIQTLFTETQRVFEKEGWKPCLSKIFTLPLGHDGSSLYTLLQNHNPSLLEEAHYFLASLSPISSLAILQHTLEQAQLHPTAYESPKKTCTALHSIKIMTSHMSKGLEYDMVFALGLCSRTPPPSSLVKVEGKTHIYQKGDSYEDTLLESIDKEKMRLFYVAITRARKKIYVPFIEDTKHKSVAKGRASPSELFFCRVGHPFISYNSLYETLPALTIKNVQERLQTIGLSAIPIHACPDHPPTPIKPTFATEEKKEAPTLSIKKPSIFSFSSLVKSPPPLSIPYVQELTKCGLPRGPHIGTLLHTLFEQALLTQRYRLNSSLLPWIKTQVQHTPLQEWASILEELLIDAFSLPFIEGQEALKNLPPSAFKTEIGFQFLQKDKSQIKGFIDVLFQYQEKLYIIDWKGNYLGPTLEHYTPAHLAKEMDRHHYNTQAKFYEKAVRGAYHHLSFGGCYYLFLRGLSPSTGVYTLQPTMHSKTPPHLK